VEDRALLGAFAAQAATAIEAKRLRRDAATASTLAQADAMRTGLLRAVSHDLRTPLAGIKASVTSLLSTDVDFEPEQKQEFLEVIDEDCDRLTKLVDNLLDASRLEAGVVAVHALAVDVADVVSSALASVDTTGHPVVTDLADDLPAVEVDPDLLERVLANLLTNAVRHSPPGTPVRVTAGAVGGQLEVLIVDRGVGIPPSQRAEVLRPFQRLDDDHSTGIGLGLSIVVGFTELLGGSLRLEDTPGGGLTVVLGLPLAESRPTGAGVPAESR
jgi:two-component system sensor histidine kinase KdpD